MALNQFKGEADLPYEHPLYDYLLRVPGLDVAVTSIDQLLTWGATNSLWIFPMATSCCGIEFMAAAASRVDIDRMGAMIRGTPRQTDVMVVAGTITVKMAPRVKRLWDQMPEPKWCVAMGSCAISGDFYRDVYSVVPGIDVALPVDVYIPGCPPNPESVMGGLLRLQEKVRLRRAGLPVPRDERPETRDRTIVPTIGRYEQRRRENPADPISLAQLESARRLLVRLPSSQPEQAPAAASTPAQEEPKP
jgi:NADH-quinone oxidoreductase subunit B